MSRNYFVLSNGRVKREQNTVFIEDASGTRRPIPIEDVESLYLYGEVDINTKLLVFLGQKKITLHVFNYFGFYSGSYYPRDYLHSGYLVVQQVSHYTDSLKRLSLARELVRASAHSMLRNVAYYDNRSGSSLPDREPDGEIGLVTSEEPLPSSAIPTDVDAENAVDSSLQAEILSDDLADPLETSIQFDELPEGLSELRQSILKLSAMIEAQSGINEIRGIEGKMRERYYKSWPLILSDKWTFERRVRRPPDNEVNALISFGNGFLYTVCLGEIYRTQLTPTISYLHEPGSRRFSLALDISEVFKPLIVDRAIFRLLNTGQLKPGHFDKQMDGCFLNDAGKKLFLTALEERLRATIKHRRLGRHISYRHLIRLECYKLVRHLTGVEPYRAFRAWW